jgi:hypothetical protein
MQALYYSLFANPISGDIAAFGSDLWKRSGERGSLATKTTRTDLAASLSVQFLHPRYDDFQLNFNC